MKPLLLLCSLVMLSGCAGMADSMDKMAGMGVISEEVSTFDNAKTIRVTPTWLYINAEDWSPSPLKMGAQWVSTAPDHIGVIVQHSGSVGTTTTTGAPAYVSISALEINIDGDFKSFTAQSDTQLSSSGYNTVSRDIYTSSKNIIVIPLQTYEAMMAAKDCRVRIHTSKGLVEANFSITRGASGGQAAAGAMAPFLAKVKQAKAG